VDQTLTHGLQAAKASAAPRGTGQRGLCVTGDLHNRQRRHSVLGSPILVEHEKPHATSSPDAHIPRSSGGAQIYLIESPSPRRSSSRAHLVTMEAFAMVVGYGWFKGSTGGSSG
jgi:hypothetical protein